MDYFKQVWLLENIIENNAIGKNIMKKNIYVASSWRNEYYPEVVAKLREAGHDVFDFRNPPSGDPGF